MADDTIKDGYYPAETLDALLGSRPATTTLIDSIFLPGRIPRDLINKMAKEPASLEKVLLAEKPLLSARQEKPYWSKGQNARPFDAVNVEVYSAVCLADDRHVLEGIISIGGMYADLSGLTLRQAIEMAEIKADYSMMSMQHQNLLDTRLFSGIYDYFLVDFGKLFEFLGLKNQKANKTTVMTRLRRLSQMLLVLDYEKEGASLPQFRSQMKLVDENYIPLLVTEGIKSKRYINSGTITHLIVGVHKTFTASLSKEGAISRSRFLSVYPRVTGKHAITDFIKWMDSHKRSYVHGKMLKDLIEDYYKNKIRISKQHITRHVNNTLNEVIRLRHILLEDFNLLLQEKESSDGTIALMVIYVGEER